MASKSESESDSDYIKERVTKMHMDNSVEPEPNGNYLSSLSNDYEPRRIEISRAVVNQTVFTVDTPADTGGFRLCSFLKKQRCSPLGCLYSLFPILQWLPQYEWGKDVSFDLAAGFTVAVMHIPQGMAYALLGNLPPIIGIYMALFPVIVYSIMGTSRHVSIGTFAVICLMTGKVAAERVSHYTQNTSNLTDNGDPDDTPVYLYTTVEIATALSFGVGIWQILMGFLRLGALSLLLSSEVVSGFTTGAAVHVLTSQLKNLFGLKGLPARNGIFKIVLTYIDIATNISTVNIAAVIMSFITIVSLVVYNEIIKPQVCKKMSFPLPVELLTIIVGTLVSSHWDMTKTFNVSIVEYIPTGLPPPALPPLNILPDIVVDSLIISIVAYAISISMSKIFALKHNYPLDPNQELIAQGASNVCGSFFSCAPISASLSRSLVQELVGGKTQLAGLFSCGIMVIVLLWIGPFFETLPNCVLSGIIVVALKGMFLQILDLPKCWKESILSGLIWIITFLVTVIVDIEYGLAIGLILSVLILLWQSNRQNIEVLGSFNDSDLYIEATHEQSKEIPGIKIIKYTGNLNFATVEHFVKKIESLVPYRKKDLGDTGNNCDKTVTLSSINLIEQGSLNFHPSSSQEDVSSLINWIILDFSGLSSTDPEALKTLRLLCKRYENGGIQMLFVACPSSVLKIMNTCLFVNQVGPTCFFPTLHDAVVFSSPHNNSSQTQTLTSTEHIN